MFIVCKLCGQKFDNWNEVKGHILSYHNVSEKFFEFSPCQFVNVAVSYEELGRFINNYTGFNLHFVISDVECKVDCLEVELVIDDLNWKQVGEFINALSNRGLSVIEVKTDDVEVLGRVVRISVCVPLKLLIKWQDNKG